MRITKETAAANRERVLEAAARLFREKGVDGIAVADLMKAAGLTHGGFYNHFESKEELAAAAFKTAFDATVARLERQAAKAGVSHFVSYLLYHVTERVSFTVSIGLATQIIKCHRNINKCTIKRPWTSHLPIGTAVL